MIEILIPGRYGNTKYEITCKCGCKFSYNYIDTVKIKSNYYSEGISRFVRCPECNDNVEATFIALQDKKEESK